MRRAAAILLSVLAAATAGAQDDRAAGLFTEARQLPLVSQAVVVRIHGGEARVELTQVYANDGAEVAQADYRLHLPRAAVVTGFGFWHDGRFLAAELQERARARREHAAAASAGHATGLLLRDDTIHSFSVFPVPAGALVEVEATIALPVASERGRASVRLPLDAFLGHARVGSTVIVHLETREPLRELGVDGAGFEQRRRAPRSAELVLAAADPVEIWWASEAPPLLVRAEEVALDDGATALQLRTALNDPDASGRGPEEIVLLVDASHSMRRRAEALGELLSRVYDQAAGPVRAVAVAERAVDLTGVDARRIRDRLLDGDAGFSCRWDDLMAAAARSGCDRPTTRCIAVTDPQVHGLTRDRGLATLFLADADELAHFDDTIGRAAPVHQPGIDPVAALYALADELVLPVLEVRAVRRGGETLEAVGTPRMQVAAGGMLRLFFESRSTGPLEVELAIDGVPVVREIRAEPLDRADRLGQAVRRGLHRGLLADWSSEYRRSRDPELRRQIVDVSLREGIPTDLTALQVASPDRVMPRTATPAPLLRAFGVALLAIGGALLAATGRRAT